MKNVVITGANGFLGSNLVGYFIELGVKVKAIVRENSNCELIKNFKCEVYVFDNTLESLSSVINADSIVIHTASLYVAEHKSSDIDILIQSNVMFGLRLLEAMKASGANCFINIGTSWQSFEGVARRPVNLYAATKQAFEDLLAYYCDAENFNAISLRLFDTYGENDSRMKLLKLLITIGISADSLDMSEGNQVIDLVHINDVCSAVYQAYLVVGSYKKLTTYNVSSEERFTLKELVKIVESETGLSLNIKWGAKPYRNREVMLPIASNPIPNFRPKYKLKDGINAILLNLTDNSKH